MSNKIALIAGATGLVGKDLLALLLSENLFDKVKVLTRRPLEKSHEKIEEVLIDDFDKLSDHSDKLDAHHFFCCLGTTMKKAGSKEMFKKIDVEYPVVLAEIAATQPSFEAYHIVTSVGSSPDSPLFYNQVKGECERKLKDLGLPALKIYQPSLLMGRRKEFRLAEEVGKALSSVLSFFVIGGREARLWSIHSTDVAKSMMVVAKRNQPGLEVLPPKNMIKLAHSSEFL